MKTILVFGDSITWGTNPAAFGARHARADRWPNALAAGLGEGYEIITEALRGRATAFDENLADCDRNGARILPTLLYSHAPLDLVILMLGCNDMKPAVAGNAASATLGMRRCMEIVRNHCPRVPGYTMPPKMLVMSPPVIVPTKDTFYANMLGEKAVEESAKLAGLYAALAVEFECGFFDAGSVAKASDFDGLHLDAANSRAIGEALVAPVRKLLAN
jgi:lysophospholipase L1-like esterase